MYLSKKELVFLSLFFFSHCLLFAQQPKKQFTQAGVWTDVNGQPINAHGAGILQYNGTYYMFGEIKKGKTWLVPGQSWEDYRVNAGGISCYASKDLMNWKYEGVALPSQSTDSTQDLYIGRVIERPKVVYNKKTQKFVMWMHIDSKDYASARAGVAVSDHPAGPYHYLGSVRPNGEMSRDMTVFKDDDEKAYLVYTSENNATMHVCLLSDDYLSPTKQDVRILENQNREAPAVFKYQDHYYLITSKCTGWLPNEALYAVADAPLGPWQMKGNPCTGPDADSTYHAQSTFVLPVDAKNGLFVFMADRWNKSDLPSSRYIWLPLQVADNQVKIKWTNEWNPALLK